MRKEKRPITDAYGEPIEVGNIESIRDILLNNDRIIIVCVNGKPKMAFMCEHGFDENLGDPDSDGSKLVKRMANMNIEKYDVVSCQRVMTFDISDKPKITNSYDLPSLIVNEL